MLTGVTSTTKENLQLGAGVVLTEYTPGGEVSPGSIIGATRGGGSFTAVPTMRQIDADGIPTNLKDFKVIDDYVVTLNTTLIEFKEEALKLAMPATSSSSSGTAKTIKAGHTIASTEYKDIYWVGDKADGGKVVIKIKNALSTSGLNLTITNKGEGTYALTVVGHYDISNLDEAPFEFILEDKGE